MKVVLTGGGTGGHIYPALSLWQHITENQPHATALYIGTNEGLERDIVSRTELPFCAISAAGLKRQISVSAAQTVLKTWRGYRQARRALKSFSPDIVVGTGGYVTLPVIYAARSLRIPSVIWEGNARPGLTNQLCARSASAIAVVFPGSERWFGKASGRVYVTGNPRASEVLRVSPAETDMAMQKFRVRPNQKLILVYTGSRGAETVNTVIASVARKMTERPHWKLIVVTGEKHFTHVREQFGADTDNVELVPFIYNMPAVLPRVDVAITRAGSSTIAEICALGIASILVPSPYVTANHQEQNAEALAKESATVMIRESDLSADGVWRELTSLLDEGRAQHIRTNAKKLATPDAVSHLYALVLKTMAPRK